MKTLVTLSLVALLLPAVAFAQRPLEYTPLEPIPGINQSGTADFPTFLKGIFTILLSIGGILAVGLLVYGGIVYMTSEISNKKSEAKRRIQAAVWGLLLLISSYLILNTINPQLLEFKFLNPGNTTAQNNTPAAQSQTPSVISAPPGKAVDGTLSLDAGTLNQSAVNELQVFENQCKQKAGGYVESVGSLATSRTFACYVNQP
jgi:hypothetical protein